MKNEYEPPVVVLAREVIGIWREIEALRAENEELREYRRKYCDLLDTSVEHGRQMMGSWVSLLLDPRSKALFSPPPAAALAETGDNK